MRAIWVLVIGSLAILASTGVASIDGVLRGSTPTIRSSTGAGEVSNTVPRPPHRRKIELAGSGSNLPLTRRLAREFNERVGWEAVLVHESIGSRGGVLASRDEVIDLGMISRPLSPVEAAQGLHVIPYARVPVVLATNSQVVDRSITRPEILEIYRAERRHWSDGSRIVVLQRERGDSSHRAFVRALPEFAEIDEESRRRGVFEVLFRDSEMQAALIEIEGSVGLFDQGAISSQALPLNVLAIDGVLPDSATVASGAYPFIKELSFVSLREPAGTTADFIAFVRSDEAGAIILSSGYLPVEEGAR